MAIRLSRARAVWRKLAATRGRRGGDAHPGEGGRIPQGAASVRKNLRRMALATALAGVTLGGFVANAFESGRDWRLTEGGYTAAPPAFTRFCLDYPEECRADGGAGELHFTADLHVELEKVNRVVNRAIVPAAPDGGVDDWRLDAAQGDCNDYAVQKRHALLALGLAPHALSLAVVRTPSQEAHLVLTVRTDAGDFVLDNLHEHVLRWDGAGYTWIMRQSERNPMYWVDLVTSGSGHARPSGAGLRDQGPTSLPAAVNSATAPGAVAGRR